MQSAESIASNGGVLTKIYVPPQIFAISSALAGLVNFFIGMIPLAIVCFISGQTLAWTLPLVLVVGVVWLAYRRPWVLHFQFVYSL
jgi:ABC-2 type transport system permease protein